MSKFELNGYCLPLLHAAKFPSSQVCGLLLGKMDKEKGSIQSIDTAVPLFHHWTTLTPMLEVALQQVELHADKKGLQIVGWYQGNERLEDTTLHENAIKVADVIRARSGAALILVINNASLSSPGKDGSNYVAFGYQDKDWRKGGMSIDVASTHQSKTVDLLNDGAYQRIVDFDQHLDDVQQDWLATCDLTW
ncbi:hypothetical protein BC940DRAFT_300377 [Gongronella butleri]|nr:hypothetical protein BC940DRAFT_300377 [Gongronella butleri]